MNTIVENMTGMDAITDQVLAFDLLFATKTGVRNLAIAITETASPEVRSVLRKHLDASIDQHARITGYLLNKGWYHAYNPAEQIQLDLKNAKTALNLS